MEIHQLRYFVAVAESGGFSTAAHLCHVSQPSLSQQIKKLEHNLGECLFDRVPQGAILTSSGQALLPRARRILTEVDAARAGIQRDVEEGAGPLAIGVIPTMGPYLLPAALERFRPAYPRCELSVREDLTDRLVDALVKHEIDLAILSTPIDNRLVELDVLATERLLLTASADSPLPKLKKIPIAALAEHPTIVVHEVHCLGQQIQQFCSSHRVDTTIICRSSQLLTVQQLVRLGLGISLVPEMAAADDPTGQLQYAPLAKPQPTRDIAIGWRKDRSRSLVARRFVEVLRENLEAGHHRLIAGRRSQDDSV